VKKDLGQAFVDWVISAEGQKAIASTRSAGSSCSSPTPVRRGMSVGSASGVGTLIAWMAFVGILAPGEGLAQERKSLLTTRLEITGEVQRKLSLSVEDLRGSRSAGAGGGGRIRRHPPLFTFVLGKVGSLETTKPLMFNTGKV